MTNGIPFSILVVDDDQDDRMIIDEAFKEIGFEAEVKKFIDGKGLLHYLDSIEPALYPSLIVLDNTLPDMDAKAMLKTLKGNTAYRNIPVVVYTSTTTAFKTDQLLSLGAHACFEKGNSMQEVITMVKAFRNLAEAKLQS